ncbi:MAG: glycosyltransferase family 4 protein [bacterium]|nr:glycosyltransferase family 4 protein [bacterium]
MTTPQPSALAYVVKRYPRFSETFIVNEILEHEKAGLQIDIFALRPVRESHFQDILAQVKAPVTYIRDITAATRSLWELMQIARTELPDFWQALDDLGEMEEGDLLQAIKLAMKARERNITHFHAHFGTLAATITRIAARLAHIPYTLTVHAKDIYHEAVDQEAMHKKLADAAAVITVSGYNRRYLQATYGEAGKRVERIYNGLHLDRFSYEPPKLNCREILAVGRLVEKKGFDVLISACALLRERGISFHCSIVGEGLKQETLAWQIRQLDLGDLVCLAGPRPHAELIRIFREAAMFVAPCVISSDGDRDGLPTVLLEAMALGTPVISTDVVGIPELVRHYDTGLCVAERDSAALADAMERLLDDTSLRTSLAGRARQLIEEEFDIRKNAAAQRKLFKMASSNLPAATAGTAVRRT